MPKRHLVGGLAVLTLLSGSLAAAPPALAQVDGQRYIVVFKDRVEPSAKTAELEREVDFSGGTVFRHAIRGFAATLTPQERDQVAADPDVLTVTPNRRFQVSTPTVKVRSGDAVPTGVRRIGASTTTLTQRTSKVAVAVLDTGIDLRNRDLPAKNGINCITPGQKAQDDHGHGTHVAGTVAGKNNGKGVVGVAPGATVYAVKVLDAQGYGDDESLICGIEWVTANAAKRRIKVANMSLGGGWDQASTSTCANDALHAAICNSTQAGVTYVVAAGNSAADLQDFVPAAYPEVLTVTAVSDSDGAPGGTGGAPGCRPSEGDDVPAGFSNYATRQVDQDHTVAGPGVCIRSTLPGGLYGSYSGTSMASPAVAGAVALCIDNGVRGADPCTGMSPAQVVGQLRGDAQAGGGTAGYIGAPDPGGLFYGHLVDARSY